MRVAFRYMEQDCRSPLAVRSGPYVQNGFFISMGRYTVKSKLSVSLSRRTFFSQILWIGSAISEGKGEIQGLLHCISRVTWIEIEKVSWTRCHLPWLEKAEHRVILIPTVDAFQTSSIHYPIPNHASAYISQINLLRG